MRIAENPSDESLAGYVDAHWKKGGPDVRERPSGEPCAEDYSANGTAGYFPATNMPAQSLPAGRGRHSRHLATAIRNICFAITL